RGALIARLTQTPIVCNFRAADIAVSGQGAPLVPAVDVCLLSHPSYDRCIQNIGGIGNLTYIPAQIPAQNSAQNPESKTNSANSPEAQNPKSKIQNPKSKILGWDTGPGNSLLDLAIQRLSQGKLTFDRDGACAAQGVPCQPLVQQWLQQDFFHQPPPKSTGRELFGEAYLDRCLDDAAPYDLSNADILATLTELTAASIAHSYQAFLPRMPDQVLLCGGGSRNGYLRERLKLNLGSAAVYTTDEMGLNADFKEAIAFAVLAYWRSKNIPGNLPEVTGARQQVLLGEIYLVA
ncbi:MAG TPA: anhydro-N-acetylmuramic acid kinase, partial [Allocoleopsis sp.]